MISTSLNLSSYIRVMIAVSIPDGVIAIFHLHNPSGRTM